MSSLKTEITDRSNVEAKNLFDSFRKSKATSIVANKEIIALSEESLAMLIKNAMIDGADIVGNRLKNTK